MDVKKVPNSSDTEHFGRSLERADMEPTVCVFRTVFLALPGNFVLRTLACQAGLCVFAYFTLQGCDPVKGGMVSNPNQVRTTW